MRKFAFKAPVIQPVLEESDQFLFFSKFSR